MEREHFSRQYDEELKAIRTRLLEMGGKVEFMLGDAMRSLVERDTELAEIAIAFDPRRSRLEISAGGEVDRELVRERAAKLFDTGFDAAPVDALLGRTRALKRHVARTPGMRPPGARAAGRARARTAREYRNASPGSQAGARGGDPADAESNAGACRIRRWGSGLGDADARDHPVHERACAVEQQQFVRSDIGHPTVRRRGLERAPSGRATRPMRRNAFGHLGIVGVIAEDDDRDRPASFDG